MKTLYEIIKTNFSGHGEETMWESTKMISEAVEESMPEEAKHQLLLDIYELMCGGHYNEYFAKEAVAKMYYKDGGDKKSYAPYWTDSAMREVYDTVRSRIPEYNCWDFYVTMHMVASDNHALLMRWFPNETQEQREARYVDMSVNWLNDEDNPYGEGKIWHYLNPKH